MPQTESMRRAALVTGGAKGIGRAVCLALAENGMNIAVNYAGSAAAAEETAAACRAFGVQAITLQADVRIATIMPTMACTTAVVVAWPTAWALRPQRMP